MLLTGEYNRFYASGFATTGTDGVALVTTEGNFYFTDSRYIEAAENTVENAAIGLADREKSYVAWLGEALALTGARRIGRPLRRRLRLLVCLSTSSMSALASRFTSSPL